jgi:multidrug efflux pump subunit AcrA (membrane-fusion protein)
MAHGTPSQVYRHRATEAIVGGCLIVLAAWLPACSREDKPASRPEQPPPVPQVEKEQPPLRITAARVKLRDVQRTVEFVGTLKPEEELTIRNESPGTVVRVLVDLGDRVTAGQLLVTLDPGQAQRALDQAEGTLAASRRALTRAKATLAASQANVVRARAVLEDAETNRRRFEALFAEGAISANQRDGAVTGSEVARATLRSAEAQVESDREAIAAAEGAIAQAEAAMATAGRRLQDTEIRAPEAGEVQKRLVSAGESAKEQTPLLVLVRTQTLKLVGEIPERFAAAVRSGQAVRLKTDANPGDQFNGEVVRVAPAITEETRSFAIEAAVPNPVGALKAGALATAEVLVGQDSGVPFIPEDAVVSLAGRTKVFVVAHGKVTERTVRLGMRQDGMVEVLEGIKPGERVANSNLGQLAEGQRVTLEAPSK